MKTKIIFDANPLVLPKSGVGFFTHEFIQSLADAYPDQISLTGHYFNFLGRKKPGDLPVGRNIAYRSTRFFPSKLLNLLRRFGLQPPLELFIKQRADAVVFMNYISMPTLRGPLRVVFIYDLSFIDCPQFVSSRNASALRKWVPYSVKNADIVLTNAEFTKQRIAEEYAVSKDKIHVLAIPSTKMADPDEEVIGKYKLQGGYMLFVGNIEPRKNILGLLKAYEKLPTELSDRYPLVLVGGKGWNDEETLECLAGLQAKGLRIVQTGYVSAQEKAALYKHAMLCVQPSHYEGFGMPILEAMSQGKPVVCSDLAVFHEVAGEAAVFFDQNDPDSIAEAIRRVLIDSKLREKMGRSSKDRIAVYKTWEDVAGDFYKIIKQGLDKNR